MRPLVLTALCAAVVAAPAPLLAQDASDGVVLAPQDEPAPFADTAEELQDPAKQRELALMLRTLSEVLLDLPLAPLMEAMGGVAERTGEAELPDMDEDATLRTLSPDAEAIPEQIEENLPRALDAMGSMAKAFEKMMPALQQMAEKMKDAAPADAE